MMMMMMMCVQKQKGIGSDHMAVYCVVSSGVLVHHRSFSRRGLTVNRPRAASLGPFLIFLALGWGGRRPLRPVSTPMPSYKSSSLRALYHFVGAFWGVPTGASGRVLAETASLVPARPDVDDLTILSLELCVCVLDTLCLSRARFICP